MEQPEVGETEPQLEVQDLPACPDCTAGAGEECREPDGSEPTVWAHPRRIERYEREFNSQATGTRVTASARGTVTKPDGTDRG